MKTFGFGQGDSHVKGKVEKFKQVTNDVDRISFPWFAKGDDGEPNFDEVTPLFAGGMTTYIKGVGKVFLTDDPAVAAEIQSFSIQEPKLRIACPVVVWPTDPSGKISSGRLKDGEWYVKLWDFTENKYGKIADVHNDWPLGKCDLKISCDDGQFQAQTFTPCPENKLREFKESDQPHKVALYKEIMVAVNKLILTVESEIAKTMTPSEIRDKLSKGGNAESVPGITPAARAALQTPDNQVEELLGDFMEDFD